MDSDLYTLLSRIRRSWPTPTALFAMLACQAIAYIALATAVSNHVLTPLRFLALGLILILSTALWAYLRRVPHVPRGRVGFVVALHYGADVNKERLQEDFVHNLRELVTGGPLGKSFFFIDLPQHHADRILDDDDAMRYRRYCGAHFFLHGRVRIREISGKPAHIIQLSGMVSHAGTNEGNALNLRTEFSELLPRALAIERENDFLAFEVTSKAINTTARYVIGIAAFITGDFDYAERLYKDLTVQLNSPVLLDTELKIKQRLPRRLAEICFARGDIAYLTWIRTGTKDTVATLRAAVSALPASEHDSYKGKLLRSILYFLDGRQTAKARGLLLTCKDVQHTDWRLSIAFLEAYDGRLRESLERYRSVEAMPCTPSTITNVESFILRVLDEEPARYQLRFILGYINWKLKRDLVVARGFLGEFVQQDTSGSYSAAVNDARQFINAIAVEEKQVNEPTMESAENTNDSL
jgi:hypothetical protein